MLASCLGGGLILLGQSRGWYGDELYFMVVGRHLTWGYADQPALLPLLAHAGDALFDGSRLGVRLPAVVLTVAGVPVTGLIAKELGGGRGAQVLAAAAYTISPQTLHNGSFLLTQTVDTLLWAVTTLLLVRWVRLRNEWLLIWLGVVCALALQAKYLIIVFWAACGLSALLVGPRELLRRQGLWVGAGLAAIAALPYLYWQSRHGWPQLRLAQTVGDEVAAFAGGRAAFLPLTLLLAGVVVGGALCCYGLWRLLRSEYLADYRFLGYTCLGVAGFFLITGGRYYYCAGLFPLCFGAAAVELYRRSGIVQRRWATIWSAYAFSAVLAVLIVVPSPLPGNTVTSPLAHGSSGWGHLADTVSEVTRDLPASTRREAVLVTEHYWQASALDWYGLRKGLPRSYSPHRGYWYFGAPPDSEIVLFVGSDPGPLRRNFRTTQELTTWQSDSGYFSGDKRVSIWLYSGRLTPWAHIWPSLYRP